SRCNAPGKGSAGALELAPIARGLAHFRSLVGLYSAGPGFADPALAGYFGIHGSPVGARLCRWLLARPRTLQVSTGAAPGSGARLDPTQERQERTCEGLRPGCDGAGGIVGRAMRVV